MKNREIKFKGILRKTNKMAFGMLMYSASDCGLVIVDTVNIPPSMSDPCGDTINIYHGIIQGTESQFTERRDKNEVEIYENDIIYNNDRKEHAVVKYVTDKAMFITEYVNSKDKFPLWESLSNLYYYVGNIFQNPELCEH